MSLNRYLNILEKFDSNKNLNTNPKKILVLSIDSEDFIINCSIAHVLVKLGHQVTFLIQNSSEKITEHYSGLPFRGIFSSIIKVIKKNEIKIESLKTTKEKKTHISVKLKKEIYRQTEEDIKRILKNPLYLKNQKNKKLFDKIKINNFNFATKFQSFVKKNNFDNYIIDSGSWAEYGVAFAILQELDKTITCYGYKNDKNTIMISKNTPFNNLNVDEAWKRNKHSSFGKPYLTIEKLSKKEFYKRNVFLSFHTEDPLNKDMIYKKLSLNKNAYTILILTNLAFDTTVLTRKTNYLFKSHFDWLKKTINFLVPKKNCNIIIRPHPAEKLTNCNMSCEKYVDLYLDKLSDNFTILPSSTSINTYGLIEVADLGLVYSSDIGWEMILKNKPVISGGMGAAWGKNIQYDPKNVNEYFSKIDFFIKRKKFTIPSFRKKNAEKFMNFYMKEVPKNFPFPLFEYWNNNTFDEVERIFKNSKISSKYKNTFENLSESLVKVKGVI